MKFVSTFVSILAASLLFGAHAGATLINTGGSEDSLQDVLNSITDGGISSIDVNNNQYAADEKWRPTASGNSTLSLIVELAGYANRNTLGIYDLLNPDTTIELFSGARDSGDRSLVAFFDTGNVLSFTLDSVYGLTATDSANFGSMEFGFYLGTPGGNTWYSQKKLNSDGVDHIVAFRGNDVDLLQLPGASSGLWSSNEYILAWEDLPSTADGYDYDFQDFVVMVESVVGVPEPAILGLLGITLASFGFANGRRRKTGA